MFQHSTYSMWRSENRIHKKNWCKIETELTLVFDRAVGRIVDLVRSLTGNDFTLRTTGTATRGRFTGTALGTGDTLPRYSNSLEAERETTASCNHMTLSVSFIGHAQETGVCDLSFNMLFFPQINSLKMFIAKLFRNHIFPSQAQSKHQNTQRPPSERALLPSMFTVCTKKL